MIELPIGKCKECGEKFRQKRNDQRFCTAEHRQKWHRRSQVRGGAAIEKLIAWRVSRGAKKGALGEIAHMVDQWITEDRKK